MLFWGLLMIFWAVGAVLTAVQVEGLGWEAHGALEMLVETDVERIFKVAMMMQMFYTLKVNDNREWTALLFTYGTYDGEMKV